VLFLDTVALAGTAVAAVILLATGGWQSVSV
jgi:hypothetical protein